MMMRRQVCRSLIVGLAVIVGLGLGVWAQSISLTVTAYSDAVRFSAQGSVKELRVEVLSLSGQKVFDSGPVLSNALDWKLFNTRGQPVANGVYLYTVTVKDPFGNVTKKLGKLAVLRGKGVAAPPLTLPTIGQMARGFPLSPLAQVISDDLRLEKAGPLLDIHTTVNSSWPQIWFRRADGLLKGSFVYKSTEDSFELRKVVAAAHQIPGLPEYERSKLRLTDTDISLYTYDGVANQERLRITSSGNVGIGTSSPSAKTHINNTADQPALRIDSSAGTNALEIYNTEGGQNLIFRVERTTGNVYADGNFTGGGADVAERIDVSEAVEPGDVVEIDPDNPGKFRKAREALSTRVAGVISTAPGVVLGNKSAESNDARPILALAGRVPVKVTAKYGAIAVGDLLVSSPIPGYAMKCPEKSQCIGAVIGKALEPLAEGVGVIEVQVMLR
jgi:hypothetical protein